MNVVSRTRPHPKKQSILPSPQPATNKRDKRALHRAICAAITYNSKFKSHGAIAEKNRNGAKFSFGGFDIVIKRGQRYILRQTPPYNMMKIVDDELGVYLIEGENQRRLKCRRAKTLLKEYIENMK